MTTTTTTEPTTVSFEVAGKTIGLMAVKVKDKDHHYYVLTPSQEKAKQATMYGVPVDALATSLPTFVVIDGVKVDLTAGLTGKDGDDPAKRRPKRAFSGAVDLPSLGIRMARVSVSQTPTGWNIIATLRRNGSSVSPEKREEAQKANLDALMALFA